MEHTKNNHDCGILMLLVSYIYLHSPHPQTFQWTSIQTPTATTQAVIQTQHVIAQSLITNTCPKLLHMIKHTPTQHPQYNHKLVSPK